MTLLPRSRAGVSPQFLREWSAEQMFKDFYVTGAYAASARWEQAALLTARTITDEAASGALTMAALNGLLPAQGRPAPRLAYVNGIFQSAYPSSNAFPASAYTASANDPSKYLADKGPGYVPSNTVTFDTALMNPLSEAWITFLAGLIQAALTAGWAGVFIDNLGYSGVTGEVEVNADGTPTVTSPRSDTTLALNPTTGQPWTKGDWVHACQVMVSKAMALVYSPGRRPIVAVNGLGDYDRYFGVTDPTGRTSALWECSDVGCAEIWLRAATNSVTSWPGEQTKWAGDLDMLLDASQNYRKPVACITKLWPTSGADPTQLAIDQWHRFTLGSFALVADGYHVLQYTPAPAGTPVGSGCHPTYRTSSVHAAGHTFTPEYRTDLGAPLTTFPASASIYASRIVSAGGDPAGNAAYYRRDFTKGVVLVNPTARYTAPIPLGGSFQPLSTALRPRQADGSAVTGPVSSLSLAPHEAAVLVAAGP